MLAAWHLEQVEVVHPFSRKTVFFHCNDWLQTTKEAGLDGCQRTLKPGGPKDSPGQQFKVDRPKNKTVAASVCDSSRFASFSRVFSGFVLLRCRS
jgi:hypothetical protein